MIKLSQTSKMPCKSWSLQALTHCNRGQKLACQENAICHSCYASKNRYLFKPIKDARQAQYDHWIWTKDLDWIDEMTAIIDKTAKTDKFGNRYFRWFDSGDLQSVSMLQEIVTIARNLPDIKFWLPTRETGILQEYFDGTRTAPINLLIRVSMDFIDETIARYKTVIHDEWTDHVTFSTVTTEPDRHQCIQSDKIIKVKGKEVTIKVCGDCRRCWDRKNEITSYALH